MIRITNQRIDNVIPKDHKLVEIQGPHAILKEGITKKKGDPIYAHEVDYVILSTRIYVKED